MKSFTIIFMVCTLFSSVIAQNNDDRITSRLILERASAVIDPEGKWESFAGKMNLSTTFSAGNTVEIEIEFDLADDFYRCTRLAGNSKIVTGVKNGQIFRSINGHTELTLNQIEKFGLDEASIMVFREWHKYHFGKFLAYRNSGAVLQDKFYKDIFNDRECYLISFRGEPGKVSNWVYTGETIFYIDAETYRLRGMQWVTGDSRAGYGTYQGVIDVNGLMVPNVRIWYSSFDNSLQGVDVFSTENASIRKSIGLVSSQQLKIENDEMLESLQACIEEINKILSGIGCPECGYVIYGIENDFNTVYFLEGWWTSREKYDFAQQHIEFLGLSGKYREVFDEVLTGPAHFRSRLHAAGR